MLFCLYALLWEGAFQPMLLGTVDKLFYTFLYERVRFSICCFASHFYCVVLHDVFQHTLFCITHLQCSIGWCVSAYAVLHHSLIVQYWMVCFSICCFAPLTYSVVLNGVFQHMLFCTTHLLFCTQFVVQYVVSHGMSCHMSCNVLLHVRSCFISRYVTYRMLFHMSCHI